MVSSAEVVVSAAVVIVDNVLVVASAVVPVVTSISVVLIVSLSYSKHSISDNPADFGHFGCSKSNNASPFCPAMMSPFIRSATYCRFISE